MKILFVIHAPKNDRTAVYRAYLNRVTYCAKLGWKGSIICPDDFHRSARAGRFMPVIYPFQAAGRIIQSREAFDLIVFHSYAGWVFNLVRLFVPRLRKIKTITAFHGVEALYFKELEKEAADSGKKLSIRFQIFYVFLINRLICLSCHLSDRIFCLNRQEKEFLVNKKYGSNEKVTAVSNDIPSDFYVQRTYAQTAKTLLFAGQWLPAKGIRYLVRAFEVLSQKFPGIELHLAGTSVSEEDVLKNFPESVKKKIRVFSALQHNQMLEHYRQADVFIFPSLYEAFGRVVGEAMATGLPVISTLVGLGYDIYRDGENCLIIPERDSNAIVNAVTRILADKNMRENLGTEARKSVQQFREEDVMREIFERYNEVATTAF